MMMLDHDIQKPKKAGSYTLYLNTSDVQKLEDICRELALYKHDRISPNFSNAIKMAIRDFEVKQSETNKEVLKEKYCSCKHKYSNHTPNGCKNVSCLCTGYVKPEIIIAK